MPREWQVLAEDLHRELDIPRDEAEFYVRTMIEGRRKPSDEGARRAAASLVARGMLIHEPRKGSFLAVHPRMALSNLFRAYEERLVRQRKEKRLMVDKLTIELIPLLPGESKGTNASSPRGGRTVTR